MSTSLGGFVTNPYTQCVAAVNTNDARQQYNAYLQIRQLGERFARGAQAKQSDVQQIIDAQVIELLCNAVVLFGDVLSKSQPGVPSPFPENLILTVLDALCHFMFFTSKLKHRFTVLPSGVPGVVNLLNRHPSEKVKAQCARLIWTLCVDYPPAKDRVSSVGALNFLVDLLQQKPLGFAFGDYVAEHACGAIWALSWDHEQNQSRFRHLKAITALISILSNALSSDRLMYLSAQALSALCWKNTENQNFCICSHGKEFFGGIRRMMNFTKSQDFNSSMPPMGNRMPMNSSSGLISTEQFIHAQAAELVSAVCYGNPIAKKMFREENLAKDLVALLGSNDLGVRIQTAGAIYSACSADPEMQIEIGVHQKGVETVLLMIKQEAGRRSLIDKMAGLVALGSLLRKNSRNQEVFVELHRTKAAMYDIRLSLPKLFAYLIESTEQEATKLPCILEAIYSICLDFYAGRIVLGDQRTNVVSFLLKVLFSATIMTPIKILAADALRVTVHRNASCQQMITAENVTRIYTMMRDSTEDAEFQFALAGVLASSCLQIDVQTPPESSQILTQLAQIPQCLELLFRIVLQR